MNLATKWTSALFFIACAGAASAADPKWPLGGTLHGATLQEWAAAPMNNRTATAADFAAAITNKAGKPFSNMVEMRLVSLELTLCIDEVAKETSLGAQGASAIAVACATQLGLM